MKKRTPKTIAKTIASATIFMKFGENLFCLRCSFSLERISEFKMAQWLKKKTATSYCNSCPVFKLGQHKNGFSQTHLFSNSSMEIFGSSHQVYPIVQWENTYLASDVYQFI